MALGAHEARGPRSTSWRPGAERLLASRPAARRVIDWAACDTASEAHRARELIPIAGHETRSRPLAGTISPPGDDARAWRLGRRRRSAWLTSVVNS